MADQEEDDLQMALKMSMQHESPEPKRSKPEDNISLEESPEVKNRRLQRELMAAAAEKRMLAAASAGAKNATSVASAPKVGKIAVAGKNVSASVASPSNVDRIAAVAMGENLGKELSSGQAHRLFSMVFGGEVTKGIISQWSNQGIRFSPDQETSMGLVQHEGGPCGVLAAIQAFVLKNLLFLPEEIGKSESNVTVTLGFRRLLENDRTMLINFGSLTEDTKLRALIKSLGEILFLCGSNKRATIASIGFLDHDIDESDESSKDEIIAKALEGVSIESSLDLQKMLKVNTFTSLISATLRLEEMIPVFRSRMGAMLFLISALLSRGLDIVESDRDDPSQPLVTAPFGHASQEIVNLLLSGKAVANVFDGEMDLGGGMFVSGISSTVQVGFLTLLESLNYCKVGQYLKSPKYPIWVVGSESHYTILFALDPSVQDENELEEREKHIRRAFDSQDQSGGGGFISVEGFHKVLEDTNIKLPTEKVDHLCGSGYIVWSEFWQVILELDKSLGGLKDSSGSMGKKVFDLFHFNGIAKSVSGSETQRPRLTRLRVSVPPKWTPEEYMTNSGSGSGPDPNDSVGEVDDKSEPAQHAPLVDCIRTRWPRAVCHWEGDPPSIV